MSLDPLAAEFPEWSDYNYVLGNPVMLIDPDGRSAASPIFGKDGTFLGTDDKGYQGEIIIMDKNQYRVMTQNGQTLKHDEVMKLTKLDPSKYSSKDNFFIAKKLVTTEISPKTWSNITTHILSKMPDVNIKNLENESISVFDGITSEAYGNPERGQRDLANTSVNEDMTINITVYLYGGEIDTSLNTVDNIRNALGSHEYKGHGIKMFGDKNQNHSKAFELQMNHPSWKDTTPTFQKEIEEKYYEYKSRGN